MVRSRWKRYRFEKRRTGLCEFFPFVCLFDFDFRVEWNTVMDVDVDMDP